MSSKRIDITIYDKLYSINYPIYIHRKANENRAKHDPSGTLVAENISGTGTMYRVYKQSSILKPVKVKHNA